MKPTKIIREEKAHIPGQQRPLIAVCVTDDGTYTNREMAEYIGIDPPSFRLRLATWGYDHPDILRKKSRLKIGGALGQNIKLDIVSGDCVGKYDGRTVKQQAENLGRIAGAGSFELTL